MGDSKRLNVAMTRAKGVRFLIGGECADHDSINGTSYVRYYRECKARGLRWEVDSELITAKNSEWVQDIVRQDVVLHRTFGDDISEA